MRHAFALAAILSLAAGPALAAADPDVHGGKPTERGAVGDRLEAGANSFTEAQVREKFETMGFAEVTDLRKDEQGIWRGRATHAGKQLSIGMDYKGNVAAE